MTDTTPREPGRRPAEVARFVTLGASGVVTFGLVGYFGLAAHTTSPDPAEQQPQPSGIPGPTAPAEPVPGPAPTSVPLTSLVAGTAPSGPVPVPTTTVAVAVGPPPTGGAPVDIVTERSR